VEEGKMIGGIQPDVPVHRETNLLANADSLRYDLIRVRPRVSLTGAAFLLFLLFSYLGDIFDGTFSGINGIKKGIML
jgi:hypothetical protein